MNREKKAIIDQLNNLRLYGIDSHIDFSSLVCIPLDEISNRKPSLRNIARGLRQFIKNNFVQTYKYSLRTNKENKMLLFYGGYWYREDHAKAFNDFAERFDYSDVIKAELFTRRHIARLVHGFIILTIWMFQGIVKRFPIPYLLYLSPYIYEAYGIRKVCRLIDYNKYKLLVVYSDLTPDENCLVQYFNHNGILTATLQHGQFSLKKNREGEKFEGIQFLYSPSYYFLCWNQYTKDMISKAGINTTNYCVLGMPKYINTKPSINSISTNKGIFGVVLNVYSKEFDYQNIEMIKAANQISEALSLGYVVRYHPTMDDRKYKEFYNDHFVKVEKSKTILDYSQQVDFSIIGSSSVFIELTYLRHTCFRLQTGPNDYYSDIPFAFFSNLNEFMKMYSDKEYLENERNKLFKYLCTTYEIFESYDRFFKSII